MSELTTTERLQPSLLDRLTDDEPDKRLESRDRRVMSMRMLRQAVLRDLTWLLNTGNRPLADEIHQFPRVARSVLNYGMPDLTGLSAAGLRTGRLEQMVFEAIVAFEPRITRETLQVRITASEDGSGSRSERSPSKIEFQINGDLCPLPMPEALFLRTEVDVETGQCEVKDSAG